MTASPVPDSPRPPRLRVTIRQGKPGGTVPAARWTLDTATLSQEAGRRLHALVDAVEAGGAPGGRPGPASRTGRGDPSGTTYEITVQRGYGHWTVRVADRPDGSEGRDHPEATCGGSALTALIDHVRGVAEPR